MKLWHVVRTDLQVSVFASKSKRECNAYVKSHRKEIAPGFLEVKQGEYRAFDDSDLKKIVDTAYDQWRQDNPEERFFDAFKK